MSTYYVSPYGSDSNSGTSTSAPWRSISKVNTRNLNAGDQVLFRGGSTFSGSLSLTSEDTGTLSSPVVVGSYGTGKATINAGTGRGVKLENVSGVTFKNLKVVGSGRSNTSFGIKVVNTGGGQRSGLRLDGLDVSGFGMYGILVTSEGTSYGFSDVRITNSSLHNNLDAGLRFAASNKDARPHKNVYVGHVRAYSNPGDGHSDTTGSGIELSQVDGAKVERSVAYNNGTNGDGGIGIWAHHANKVVIQYCESYNNRTDGVRDGGGFDFDVDTSYSVMQYNYSHGNDGHGFQLNQWANNSKFTGNVIRFNISENNARKHSYAGIGVWGKVLNSQIYNNTIYMTPNSSGGSVRGMKIHNYGASGLYVSGLSVRNNIITTRGVPAVEVMSGMLSGARNISFQGNAYWSYSGSLSIIWGSSRYSTVSAWRSAKGQEKLDGRAVGFQVDPKLSRPGGGWTVGNANDLDEMTAYALRSDSPLRYKAISTTSTVGGSVPSSFSTRDLGAGVIR